MADEIKEGDVFRVRFPFVRKLGFVGHDDDGHCYEETWTPGVGNRLVYPDDAEAYANGEGWQILTVVSTHKPGRFPMRVFYTQEWEDPDGRVFGKAKCRVLTVQAFRWRIAGFGVNVGGIPYKVDSEERGD